jgi:hypothetical protein
MLLPCPVAGAVLGLVRLPDDPLRRPLNPDGPAAYSPPSLCAASEADFGGAPEGLFRSTTVGSSGIEMDRGDLFGAAPPVLLALADKVIW